MVADETLVCRGRNGNGESVVFAKDADGGVDVGNVAKDAWSNEKPSLVSRAGRRCLLKCFTDLL